jgi:hypothetical protein
VHIMSRAHIVLRLFTTPFLRSLRLVNCECEDGGTYNIDIDRPDTSGAFISGTTPRSMSLSIYNRDEMEHTASSSLTIF